MSERAPEILALVPARGGSKSIPRKNLKRLAGHPLLAFSVAAARASRHVSRVILSTDDDEIRAFGRAYGAETPFLRPAELARDDTPDLPVFEHALRFLEREEGYRPDLVVHLRPTSPLRPRGLVEEAIQVLERHPDGDSLRSICPTPQNPYKMWALDGELLRPLLSGTDEEAYNLPRQRLPPTFWQTGQIDVIRRATILEQRSMTGRRIVPLIVDPAWAVDIDAPHQLLLAAWLLERGEGELVRPESVA